MKLDLGPVGPGSCDNGKQREGPHGFLTDEHSASRPDVLVLVIEGHGYGPADALPYPRPEGLRRHQLEWTGAAPVWLVCHLAPAGHPYWKAGKSYLSQWPEGPQLD